MITHSSSGGSLRNGSGLRVTSVQQVEATNVASCAVDCASRHAPPPRRSGYRRPQRRRRRSMPVGEGSFCIRGYQIV